VLLADPRVEGAALWLKLELAGMEASNRSNCLEGYSPSMLVHESPILQAALTPVRLVWQQYLKKLLEASQP
jgi:hypothetical protein